MISVSVTTQVANFIRSNILTTGNQIGVFSSIGELFRKPPANVQYVSQELTQYTFYLNEEEAKNTTIVQFKLYDTVGNEVASQVVNRVKGYPESLLVTWNLEVKQQG